ncbi:low temperature requirement protein LtrA [Ceratobasidium sp. AG-Ba]|nr:low temperature requirement protein LtrA [Ceratobasidium sp. AG-Ba]
MAAQLILMHILGVKNQLLLSSFLSTVNYLSDKITDVFVSDLVTPDGDLDQAAFNRTLGPLLLQSGLSMNDQWQRLVDLVQTNMTATNATELDDQSATQLTLIWFFRMQMSSILNSYINFMDNETVADELQQTYSNYQNNYTFAYQDIDPNLNLNIFAGFFWDLIHASVNNARYIMALCGLTFICLATLNLIQSWPRGKCYSSHSFMRLISCPLPTDRFHWASIISRYLMGFCMLLLLLLNVGKYQTYFAPGSAEDESVNKQRAGVFNWIDSNWVLPTLTLAYAIQFVVDTALVYIAVWYTRKSHPSIAKTIEKSH